MARPGQQALIQPSLLETPAYSVEWSVLWTVQINEDKIQAISFSRGHRPVEPHVTVIRRNIPFVHHVKHLDVTFDRMSKCTNHVQIHEVKAFRTLNRVQCRSTSERFSVKTNFIIRRALLRSGTCPPRLGICFRNSSLEVAAPAILHSPYNRQLSKAHTVRHLNMALKQRA